MAIFTQKHVLRLVSGFVGLRHICYLHIQDTKHHKSIQYNTIQYNTIQYNTIQYNTTQYNTIQYNTIQYSTLQYNHDNISIFIYSDSITKSRHLDYSGGTVGNPDQDETCCQEVPCLTSNDSKHTDYQYARITIAGEGFNQMFREKVTAMKYGSICPFHDKNYDALKCGR